MSGRPELLSIIVPRLQLPHVVFDDGSYLRFLLLPTLPLVLILMVAAIECFLAEARDRSVFRLEQLESRYARGGEFAARRLPPTEYAR